MKLNTNHHHLRTTLKTPKITNNVPIKHKAFKLYPYLIILIK